MSEQILGILSKEAFTRQGIMSDQIDNHAMIVEEIMERIRERARLRRQAGNDKSMPGAAGSILVAPEKAATTFLAYDPSAMHQVVATVNSLRNQVGEINPRRPGLHNDLIQLVKKTLRRMLAWYTRPLHEFHAAVSRAFNEMVSVAENLQGNMNSLAQRIDTLGTSQNSLAQRIDTLGTSQNSLAQRIETLGASQDSLAQQVNALGERLKGLEHARQQSDQNIQQIRISTLATADSHLGPKAAEGLWFNEPIILEFDSKGRPAWFRTSERIIEKAWVLRHLEGLDNGSKILDVGCAESLLSMELASNGFLVIGVDVRHFPLSHPNFHLIQGDVTTAPLEPCFFDAAILLSTIEHIGLGWYGDPKGENQQEAAMAQIYRLLKPGGRLLVTVPFGRPALTPLHRIFDPPGLRKLLEKFKIESLEFGIKVDEKTWCVPASEEEAGTKAHHPENHSPGAVALAVCKKASGTRRGKHRRAREERNLI
ncbi:MAG: methyltransferase domain-containing protein [Terriglobia bacterium]|jgi:SAM-dependent methyltransferase/uncharacterized protein YoxC